MSLQNFGPSSGALGSAVILFCAIKLAVGAYLELSVSCE